MGVRRSRGHRLPRERDRRERAPTSGQAVGQPALVADGKHARVDGFVSLGVIASAVLVALGWQTGDRSWAF
jgi:divalent metal cation (Fe/Co/Zn/Cd) transporter